MGLSGVESVAVKTVAYFVLLSAILASDLLAQTQPSLDQDRGKAFQKQLFRDNVYAFISTGVAETLLIHKVDPVLKHPAVEARQSAKVVVGIELGKNGEVLHPMVVSEPNADEQAVLDAVRQYKFKPYFLNGEAIVVATWVLVNVPNE